MEVPVLGDKSSLRDRVEYLENYIRWTMRFQPEALATMKANDIVIDDLDDEMQKFAFTMYNNLLEINLSGTQAINGDWSDK